MPPGTQDPRTRAFTKTIVDPKWAADPKWQALPEAQRNDLAFMLPPEEDLDRIALFAPPAPGHSWYSWPGGIEQASISGPLGTPAKTHDDRRDATWNDIVALGPDVVKACLAWWRQAVALGPLPEDDETDEEDDRSSSYNWPCAGCNRKRYIYFWGFGKDGRLYKHLQVQKKDSSDRWQIFNKWGTNLTFVWRPSEGQWIAGFDVGDWFTQNKMAVAAGIQIACQAIITVVSLGTAAPGTVLATAATLSAVFAANQALGAAMTGIATGNWDAALASVYKMGAALADVPEVKEAIGKSQEMKDFLSSEPMRAVAKVTAGMKWPPSPEDLVRRAGELAFQIPMGVDFLKKARESMPDNVRPFFDMAWSKGKAAVEVRAKVPWYGQGAWDFGMMMGALADARSAITNVQYGGEATLTVSQSLAIAKQRAYQKEPSVKQILEEKAGVKAPRRLPPDGSRSPKPASEAGGKGAIAIGLVVLVLVAWFFFR